MTKNSERDLFALPEDEPFIIEESSLESLLDSPIRISHGVVILCLKGDGIMTVNFEKYHLNKYSQLYLLPQSIFTLDHKSDDFRIFYFSFSLSMFHEAFFMIDSELFGFLKENALFNFPPEVFLEKEYFFRLMKSVFNDRNNKFRKKIATNYLQNYFLDTFDKISYDKINKGTKDAGRKKELFKKFVQSVHENYKNTREVNFYADKLSISTRYLSAITKSVDNCTAKEFIDNCVVQEIKLLLHSSNLSIQEIADRLNFQDQSNLSRFFKKQTGISPTTYRKRK